MIITAAIMLFVGFLAGTLGAILGIGGGMIVTPIVTLLFGLNIKYAIGASIIAVIATSSGSTIAFLKDDLINLRVAMFLEVATASGAVIGALLTGSMNGKILYFLFGCLLLFASFNMVRKLMAGEEVLHRAKPDKWAVRFKLNSSYYDKSTHEEVNYDVQNIPGGLAIMFGAGLASGMLGIGSGAFKVMALDNAMKMPLKPSSATSNLMMGVTAAASATVYFFSGAIRPEIAVPLALGILVGSLLGSRIMQKLPTRVLRMIFVPVFLYLGLQMALKAFGINIG
ncbi:sulfite exporter TauE/SafE family protein [Ligilactobacillus hohenheimensis]|uniref:sulfite exporter TauE/SafE family protein n=1 Tax=Ligilactobacillus hohenheimensis TaxID=2991832 RepID=UPI0024BA0FDA|nr:sulfite exporter TauE/SafE family protein [Ligilactobacillus hohenheimensis]